MGSILSTVNANICKDCYLVQILSSWPDASEYSLDKFIRFVSNSLAKSEAFEGNPRK